MILVTGGCGFIGSHTCVSLHQAGLEFVILDNFSNSDRSIPRRISKITGTMPTVFEGDVGDSAFVRSVLESCQIDSVIHFAGLKSVSESVETPIEYYRNNVAGSIALLDAMIKAGCKTIVFSSSATVYGDPKTLPVPETAPFGTTNPYGRSKQIVEEILCDLYQSDPAWRIARLRYFNPAGAHSSGLIGELPRGTPNNLVPFVVRAAAGAEPTVNIYGTDYATPDGTGVRDYIHVMDLADGHVASLSFLKNNTCNIAVNLGTGRGSSVIDVVSAMEQATGKPIVRTFVARRPGDVASSYADVSLANALFQWQARRNLNEMCEDAWRWQNSYSNA